MIYYSDHQIVMDENCAFQIAAFSVIGDRDEQQDSIGYSLKQEEGIVVLCDGMGGREGGKTAAEITVQNFLTQYDENYLLMNQTDMLIGTAKETDSMIAQLRNENGELLKAGSTLVSIIVNRKKLLWCSVGDSRAYLIRDGEMVQLTQDQNYHTVLVEKMNAGLLDEEEFRSEDVRGEALISFLGMGNLALIDYSKAALELKKDDKIVVMSDGLYKIVSDPEIARIIDNFHNIGEAVQALEMKAKKKARKGNLSRDNMTVALIKIK